jgi:hypothetical protein
MPNANVDRLVDGGFSDGSSAAVGRGDRNRSCRVDRRPSRPSRPVWPPPGGPQWAAAEAHHFDRLGSAGGGTTARARPPAKGRSRVLPPYLRKTKSLEELIPWLYSKGISTGDFSEALAALVGPQAKGRRPQVLVGSTARDFAGQVDAHSQSELVQQWCKCWLLGRILRTRAAIKYPTS